MARTWLVLVIGLAVLLVAGGVALVRRAPDPVVRTVTVARPQSVAVDDRTGRAFIVTSAAASGRFSGSSAGSVRMLDITTGALLRTIPLPGGPDTLTLDDRTGRVFVIGATAGGASASVTMLDARTGSVLHTAVLDTTPALPVTMALDARRGRVFVAGFGFGTCTDSSEAGGCSRVSVLDAASGRLVHSFAVQGQVVALAADGRANHLLVTDGATNGRTGTVSVLDATSGRLVRSDSLGSLPTSVLVDETTERAFVLGINNAVTPSSGSVSVLDTRSGALLRTDRLASPPVAATVDEQAGLTIVVSRTVSHVGTGRLSVLDGRSGAVLRTTTVGVTPTALAVDTRRGRVLVASEGPLRGKAFSGPGSISVVDERSGSLVQTLPAGVFPIALAVDGRANRAVVVNLGGAIQASDPWGWMPGWLRHWLPFVPPHPARTSPSSVTVLDTSR